MPGLTCFVNRRHRQGIFSSNPFPIKPHGNPVMTDSTTPRPNILFIVPEDLGPQLGCYGDPVARTPRIDALASAGVRFTNASVPYSIC